MLPSKQQQYIIRKQKFFLQLQKQENNVDETTGNHSAIENTSDSEVTVMNIEGQKWDKMLDLWVEGAAESPYAELMTYQAEVNNGGHDQYFCRIEVVQTFFSPP